MKKTAIVTGGSSGIGRACVYKFLEAGYSVCNLDLAPYKPDYFIDKGEYHFISTDVSQSDSVLAAFEQIDTVFNSLDILVNSAGIQHYGTVTDTLEEEWDRVMDINLKGSFLTSKYALQRMNQGVIVQIASVQSLHSQSNVAAYTTSKSGLLGLTRSIAIDFAPKIRCVAVCPGSVDTEMLRHSAALSGNEESFFNELEQMHLSMRIAQPEEIASLVEYLTKDEASFITGQAIRIDGGLGVALSGSVD